MNLLDKYLASRRLEEQYQDIETDAFGNEYLNLNKQDISTTGKRSSSGFSNHIHIHTFLISNDSAY
jgi:hypothetical protein